MLSSKKDIVICTLYISMTWNSTFKCYRYILSVYMQ